MTTCHVVATTVPVAVVVACVEEDHPPPPPHAAVPLEDDVHEQSPSYSVVDVSPFGQLSFGTTICSPGPGIHL